MNELRSLEIMDTTLRDGEQTSGVSFNADEKLGVAKLLLQSVKVDRLEVASARVSEGEFQAVKRITKWAEENGMIDKIEVLGFIDGKASLDWIYKSGARVVNLLSKGSLKHLQGQLRKTPGQHVQDVKDAVAYAEELGIKVNLYLEDWSNGMLTSRDYVWYLLDELQNENIQRFMLPDTLGVMNQVQAFDFCYACRERYPRLHFDFHAHNDYDLALANVYSSILAGVNGIHTTVNGLGERAGNAPLASVVGVIKDHLSRQINVNEEKINTVSRIVETFSGVRIPANKPLVGENVFTQTCGVHADGDSKDDLYFNRLMPERFGRERKYALGKTSGKANIKKNLEELGMTLEEETMRKVTQRVIELGDKKETVTTEDLPYIVSDVLNQSMEEMPISIKHYSLSLSKGMRPFASVNLEINGQMQEGTASGDGQYDAFMNAIWSVYEQLGKDRPVLKDYFVRIPPGGKTDALVETLITWDFNGKEFKTRGLDPDQVEAAIKATARMLNLLEQQNNVENKKIKTE
ncbi:alpha-isopropylmalate synthase regulatory domain-containing protein [Marinifilum fragile]|uniref:alpha-isopropylmalate synthase regulatory domain-containing protein n=1 Tax=Marinifilum fragile TaxID=570161 RepID=UPI0006D0046C|nr:alpha-isopropylmalate synthase regulatory domain-containing protein [Marinifilum fragile]